MLIHWVAPFLSAQLDHGFTIKRSGSLDYYQQPGMYWIRYEMVQLNSQCFHGNVLAVSIYQFLQWINMFLICYTVHMLLYWFHFNLDWDATPPHSFFSPIIHTDICQLSFHRTCSVSISPRTVKRTVYSMLTPKHLPDVADCSNDVSRAPLSCNKWDNRSAVVCALYKHILSF